MKSRIPFVATVVGALLVGGATTGSTHASWTDQAPLQAASAASGRMSFVASTPADITVDQADGATAETTLVLDDTSSGRNLRQRITATVVGAPSGVTARIGSSCAATGTSVSIDTTPASADQPLCVRVTSSAAAVGGLVTVQLSGAQRPSGWTATVTPVTFAVTVRPVGFALSCGEATTPEPAFGMSWADNGADLYTVHRASSPTGPWQVAGVVTVGPRLYTETAWSQNQESYFRVEARKNGAVLATSNVLKVRRNGVSHNFTCEVLP